MKVAVYAQVYYPLYDLYELNLCLIVIRKTNKKGITVNNRRATYSFREGCIFLKSQVATRLQEIEYQVSESAARKSGFSCIENISKKIGIR